MSQNIRRLAWAAMGAMAVLGLWNAMSAGAAGPTPSDVEASQRVLDAPGDFSAPLREAEGAVAAWGVIEPASPPMHLSFHSAGVVAEVRVKVGDKVVAGDTLARLQGDRQEARLRNRQAQVKRAEEGPTVDEIASAEAEVQAARARASSSAADRNVARALAERRATTDENLWRTEAQAEADAATLAGAEARLDGLRRGTRREDLDAAHASMAEAIAERDETLLVAPAAGEVLRIEVEVGEYAAPGTVVMVIGDTSSLRARVEVDERDVARTVMGAQGDIVADAFPTPVPFRVVEVGRQMVTKTTYSTGSAERSDTTVLPVVVALDPTPVPFPIGLRVAATFRHPSTELGAVPAVR